jgi:hypothetical protein
MSTVRISLPWRLRASMEEMRMRTDLRRGVAVAALCVVFAGSYAVGRATVKHGRAHPQAGLPVASSAAIPGSLDSVTPGAGGTPAVTSTSTAQVVQIHHARHSQPGSHPRLTASVGAHTAPRPRPVARSRHAQPPAQPRPTRATSPPVAPHRASHHHAHTHPPAQTPQPSSSPAPVETPVANVPAAAAPPRSEPTDHPVPAHSNPPPSKPAKSGGGSFDNSG